MSWSIPLLGVAVPLGIARLDDEQNEIKSEGYS